LPNSERVDGKLPSDSSLLYGGAQVEPSLLRRLRGLMPILSDQWPTPLFV